MLTLFICGCNIYLFLKLGNRIFQEVILFFQNPADPKVQFDASTYKEVE